MAGEKRYFNRRLICVIDEETPSLIAIGDGGGGDGNSAFNGHQQQQQKKSKALSERQLP